MSDVTTGLAGKWVVVICFLRIGSGALPPSMQPTHEHVWHYTANERRSGTTGRPCTGAAMVGRRREGEPGRSLSR